MIFDQRQIQLLNDEPVDWRARVNSQVGKAKKNQEKVDENDKAEEAVFSAAERDFSGEEEMNKGI